MSKGIVLFLEGDTEEEIYRKFIEKLHARSTGERFAVERLIVRNLKGIGNYKNRVVRVFTRQIQQSNPGIDFDVFLCYDTDVFDFSTNPPVDWAEVEKSLIAAGAKRVVHIKAKHSIEDWILSDFQGLCNYLKLPVTTNVSGSVGLKKVENLFKKANKVYVKGSKVKGLVEVLDIQKIMCAACSQLKILCKVLGIKCDKE